jgi:hypothetical protein
MIWLLAQPAKQKQLKVIVSVFWCMGRWRHGPVLIGDMRILGAHVLKIRDVGPKARAVICPDGLFCKFRVHPQLQKYFVSRLTQITS